jgi:hypothetical protein
MRIRTLLGVCCAALTIGTPLTAAGSAAASTEAKPFGITKFTMQTTGPTREEGNCTNDAGGQTGSCRFVNEPYTFTQAGGHPWALTTTIRFASEEFPSEAPGLRNPVGPTRDPKDIVVDLPPGLLGDPLAVPRCSLTEILDKRERCPDVTQVGWARIVLFGGKEDAGPIVNLTPEAGQSAEFGLENETKFTYVLTAHLVRTAQGVSGCTTVGGCYGFTVVSNGIPVTELLEVEATFWGVPADPSHDPQRGLICKKASKLGELPFYLSCPIPGGAPSGEPPVPFLTMPTDCAAGPEIGSVRADSWEEPGRVGVNGQYEGYVEAHAVFPTVASGPPRGVTGCNVLAFGPSIGVEPDVLLADEPVGLGVSLRVPLVEKPEANATPQLRDSVVTLPEGMSVSPGVVDGIQACDAFGPQGINITGPESEEVGLNGELQLASGHCPDASIVGTAEAITPFLGEPVRGHVYLARPGCGGAGQNGCTEQDALDGNLYRLYLELGGTGELAKTGVHFKVALETDANPATGQLTTRALGNPQAPFSELRIHLNGGPRAPLDNPGVCGPAVTTADFTPWSAPGTTPEGLLVAGTPDATPSSFYEVMGCESPPGLNPGFAAGMVRRQAGQFSSFTLSLSRQDREQYVKGIQVHTPPGLLGMLASVPLCGEPEADNGHCSLASRIGSTRAASGAGSHPFEIEGSVYLTGPYRGDPFGLSIVVPVVAGPFNLGLRVVRARIAVDPETSVLTVTTDETGPYAVPQIVFGVPVRLKRVTVNIDRPGFMFNPTNCSAQRITASISGSQGAVANVSSPFAAGGCKSLAFKPKFSVSTSGHTSRAKGASLDAKLSYPSGSLGNDANIARVKVDLPKQLPSRLTTLQKACPAAAFNANPAGCPAASIVGIVRASTPLLPVGLTGPVYFVSHGGEAFPSLIVVLQGDGVRVDLTGTTFISKAGITSSTFKTVPDVPVNTFELYLPEGRYSALAANGNLCKSQGKLKMPTEFVAQNGAILKQSTKIQVTGCKAGTARSARGHGAKQSRQGAGARSARARQTTGTGR